MSATSENMTLHVDMTAKKVAPSPTTGCARSARMKVAVRLPRPEARAPHRDAGEKARRSEFLAAPPPRQSGAVPFSGHQIR
jgi:hypothetical protein